MEESGSEEGTLPQVVSRYATLRGGGQFVNITGEWMMLGWPADSWGSLQKEQRAYIQVLSMASGKYGTVM